MRIYELKNFIRGIRIHSLIRIGKRGLSLVEVVMSIGLITMLFGGVLLAYFSIIMVVGNSALRNQAIVILNREVEVIRDLPYAQVGVSGGIPSGVLTSPKTIISGLNSFIVNTTVRNIDDPFDGTLGGSPNDTAPADYKLVEIEVSCPNCQNFMPIAFSTTVAPKALESASTNGSLFINVFDASGIGIMDATVRVTNASVTPAIDLTDTTNASGILQFVGVPTSTQNYHMVIEKPAYSREQTYHPGSPPNPVKPDATVVVQAGTSISFSIDKVSSLMVKTVTPVCASVASKSFSLQGAKLIATGPNVLKYSTTTTTNASGTKNWDNIEWDTYTILYTGASSNLFGTSILSPFVIDPNTSTTFLFTLVSPQNNALLVTLKTGSGAGVASGTVTLTKAGFSETKNAGRWSLAHTDWSGSQYALQDGGIDAVSVPGALTLFVNASGTYEADVTHWLISNTFDSGDSSTNWRSLDWNPVSQPAQTGAGSLKFQLAGNNDNTTWNFTGPDGTANTYYNATGSLPSAHNGNRYLRYKVFLTTADEDYTPELDDITVSFGGPCVPPYQAYFDGLSAATYTVTASASGYTTATTSIAVSGAWQEVSVTMNP
ncbi:MAG: hypothetical protein Q7S28_01645 [bacterium]|nr:hypothetical protein [bacterium]